MTSKLWAFDASLIVANTVALRAPHRHPLTLSLHTRLDSTRLLGTTTLGGVYRGILSCAPAPQLRLHDAASAACSGLSVCGLSVWPFAYDFLFFRLGSESQFPEFAHPEGARPAEGGERGGRGLPAPCLGTAVCCDNLSPRGFWPSGAVIAFRT